MIEWTSNNTNVFLEACSLHRTCSSVGSLNLIGVQQLNDLVHMTKSKNMCTWIVQYKKHIKLNAAEVRKLKSPNNIYLYSNVGI